MADDLTKPRGFNMWPTAHNRVAKDVGMVTDGVSLEKGYKVVSPQGESPQAHTVNDSEKTKG